MTGLLEVSVDLSVYDEFCWACKICGSREYSLKVPEDVVKKIKCGVCGEREWGVSDPLTPHDFCVKLR